MRYLTVFYPEWLIKKAATILTPFLLLGRKG